LTQPEGERALEPFVSRKSVVESSVAGWQLGIPVGPSGKYRLAQLFDYKARRRTEFPWRPPFLLSLRARISPTVDTGTWGFGLWNDPFGLTLNPLGRRLDLPTGPQAAWFFWASPASYLSLRDDLPANGMMAQTFRAVPGWKGLPPAACIVAFNRKRGREMLRRGLAEDSACLESDSRTWHKYEIFWEDQSVEFLVDGRTILRTAVAPRPPLGMVIWIDNQFAAFDPQGRLAWGFEATGVDARLEVRDLKTASGASMGFPIGSGGRPKPPNEGGRDR
jgi:hypothetical protein